MVHATPKPTAKTSRIILSKSQDIVSPILSTPESLHSNYNSSIDKKSFHSLFE